MARQISNITNNGSQTMTLVGDNSEVVSFSLSFMERQNSWFFNVSYAGENFILNGAQLTISPNILRGYRRFLPFGIMCNSTDNYEPQFLNDFVDGRVSLYLLSAAEVAEIEAQLYT